ncbi:MAG: isocitrate/isopropylmalate dehydrogenase family protein, partial [bacterium]
VTFRENTEGLYSGIENYDDRLEIADSINRITRRGSERIIRACFEWADKHDRKLVTLVHKANILKKSSGMFLDIGREIATEYERIEFNDRIIDNMCMQLVQHPEDYDFIVTTNLFGDIISDLTAGLAGGLGVVPGANIGDDYAVFEAVHGSAPDIAGEGIANPTALIRTAGMMFEHLGENHVAQAIEDSVESVYREGTHLTPDMGGELSTMEFADRMAEEVKIQLA